MKRSTLGRLVVLALMLCLVTTTLLSGTLAAYTTEITGSLATATVAAWAFEIDEASYAAASTAALSYTLEGSGSGKKLVPGDEGIFNVYIDASGSDVAVDYQIQFTAIPTGITLKLGNSSGDEILVASSKYVIGSLKQADTMQVTVPIHWEYPLTTTTAMTWSDIAFTITGQQGVAIVDAAASVSSTTNIE